MKTEKNILMAFLLNFAFSLFECMGGLLTGSVAILSDALHDMGDAASIGISFLLERKSKKRPDDRYTYGYARYSVMGSVITSLMLLVGSVAVIVHAVWRVIEPVEVDGNGMILFAVVGVCVNGGAAFFTRGGDSLNQRAVNLHMLEDVLGWGVVLVGAIVLKWTGLSVVDPLMSVGVAVWILIRAARSVREAADVFLEKTPRGVDPDAIRAHILETDGVLDVHHVHVWSMDGQHHYATMHIVAKGDAHAVKEQVRGELRRHGIGHVTLELEENGEACHEVTCHMGEHDAMAHHHHHHHHHH